MFLSPVSSSVSRSDLTPNGPLLTSVRSFLSSPAPSTERPWGLMSLGAGRSRLRSQPVGSAALNAFLCPSCSNVSFVTRHSDAYVPESWRVGETPSWFPACPSRKASSLGLRELRLPPSTRAWPPARGHPPGRPLPVARCSFPLLGRCRRPRTPVQPHFPGGCEHLSSRRMSQRKDATLDGSSHVTRGGLGYSCAPLLGPHCVIFFFYHPVYQRNTPSPLRPLD